MKNPRERQGSHRRYFWRIRHRLGPKWWLIPESEVKKMLRQWSWRRAH